MLFRSDISTLPVFDIENIFLNLRARSVGEQISLKYRCNNDVTDAEGTHKCGNLVPIELNTAVGWHLNKLENEDSILDLSGIETLISTNGITKLVYIGALYNIDKKFKAFYFEA